MNEKKTNTQSTTSMQSIAIAGAGNFKFSAVRPDELGACEYTLVTIAVDTSSSVHAFSNQLKDCVIAVIEAASRSPRADNLLLRLVRFDSQLTEIFGFMALSDVDPGGIGSFDPEGMTALYDVCYETFSATEQYAALLHEQDFDVNAAVYVITDGWDTGSKAAYPSMIADRVDRIRTQEKLQSVVTLLIGINTADADMRACLDKFAVEAKFDRFVDAGDATAANLAKLAGYVSRSITTQSRALGSGGTQSQDLTF